MKIKAKKIKHDNYHFSDKVVRVFLSSIWFILIIFGILTIIQPKWLADISKPGRKEEAQASIDWANRLMYEANQKNSAETYENALMNYRKALTIDSLNTEAIGNMGAAYLFLNRLDEAKERFIKCLKLDTIYDYYTYMYLGDCYDRKGETKKALEYYLSSAKTHATPAYPLRKAGLLSIQIQNFDDAIKYLNQSIELEKSFEHFYKIGLVTAKYKAMSDKDTTKIRIISKELQKKDYINDFKRYDPYYFEETCETSKEIAYAYMYLGDAYSLKSEFAIAAENYQLSLQYNPAFFEMIKDKLATALEKAKNN